MKRYLSLSLLVLLVSCAHHNVVSTVINPELESNSSKNIPLIIELMGFVQHKISYATDLEVYQQNEYWATPSETLERMKGDCEDKAFLLSSLLLNRNISNRVVIGKMQATDTLDFHAWVEIRIDQTWYIADPIGGMGVFIIKRTDRTNYLPINDNAITAVFLRSKQEYELRLATAQLVNVAKYLSIE